MKVISSGDIVTGLVQGDGADGLPLPSNLSGVPMERLRVKAGAVIDVKETTTFYVGADGVKHISAGGGRQKVTCAWDANLIYDGESWAPRTAADRLTRSIKASCSKRIYAEVDSAAQMNLAAAAAGGILDAGQMQAYRDGLAWIAAMRATCQTLIANEDGTFALDHHWPTIPADAKALAGAF